MKKSRPALKALLLTLIALALILTACTEGHPSPAPHEDIEPPSENSTNPEGGGHEEEPEIPKAAGPLTPGELAMYRPNELGEVMVLMYHSIGEKEGEWTRTPENFHMDLNELYRRGYRTVSLLDFVRGEIDIPAGTSPVILTFDDSTRGQFNYLETPEGVKLDPDSAVGILEDFYRQNPEFGRAATFYIFYPQPFRQQALIQKKLAFLRDNGYEIGNHSYTHANLGKASDTEVVRQLALHAGKTGEILPGYEVRSLALPYGIYPKDASLAEAGEYEGYAYGNEAVLLVGYRPVPSPFAANFNPLRLARVRASETKVDNLGMYDWLAYFETHSHRRYVSDGNPNTVTAPERYREKVNLPSLGEREMVFYSLEE